MSLHQMMQTSRGSGKCVLEMCHVTLSIGLKQTERLKKEQIKIKITYRNTVG